MSAPSESFISISLLDAYNAAFHSISIAGGRRTVEVPSANSSSLSVVTILNFVRRQNVQCLSVLTPVGKPGSIAQLNQNVVEAVKKVQKEVKIHSDQIRGLLVQVVVWVFGSSK